MYILIRALGAETLKLKRTLALRLAFIAPLVVPGFILLAFLGQDGAYVESPPENAWVGFAQMVNIFWSLLILPLFITLQAALLAGVEHQNEQWKHL